MSKFNPLSAAIGYALLAGSMTLAASPAFAQQPAPADPAEQTEEQVLDVIVVTSRKREENIMRVPMNITAISDVEIKDRNLANVQDIYRTIAGGASATGELILRGLSGSNSPSPGTTSQFVDGVPFGFSNLFDIERVEVLRGPQGTLYGSNAIGGTVRIITRKPQFNEFEIFSTLRAGQQKNVDGTSTRIESGINIPLLDDRLAMRVAASVNNTPLAMVNAFTGLQSHREGEFLRAQLQWNPIDDLHINVGQIYTESRGTGTGTADRSRPGFRRFATFTANPASPWGFDVGYSRVNCPPLQERPQCYGGAQIIESNPRYTVYDLIDGWFDNSTNLTSISLDHDNLFGIASLHYVGSYRTNKSGSLDNWSRLDMDDMMRTWIINSDETSRVTHELRLQNIERIRGFDWTLGLYQDRSYAGYNPNQQWQYHDADPQSIALFSDWNDWAWGPDWAARGVNNVGQLGQVLYGNSRTNYNLTRNYSNAEERAGFGELSYMIETGIGDLEVTGGIRYFDLSDASSSFSSGIWVGPEGNLSTSAGEESGNRKKLSVAYMPSNDLNVYALYSEGYRPGGNNFPVLPNACAGDAFAGSFSPRYSSDQIENTEIGLKANMFDRRLHVSTAIYNIDWTGVRASIYMPSCGFSYTANASSARSNGFEFESSLWVNESTSLTFNASYTDSYMTADNAAIGARAGDSMTMVPKYNGYLALDREFEVFSREAAARIDVAAYGSFKSHFNTRPEDEVPSYQTVNLSGRIKLNEQTTISLHVANLLNEEYATYRSARSRTSNRQALSEIYGAERSVTLRLDYALF